MSFFGGEQYVDLGVAAKFLAVATAASVGSSVITEHTWIPVGVAVAGGIGAIVLSWRAATYWAFMRADMRTLRNSVESLKQELREHVLREEKDLRSIHDRIEKRGRDQGEN